MIRRLLAALDRLFPSVPPADQARLLAAMEGRPMIPAVGARGSAPTAGQTPTPVTPTSAGVGQTPEGEAAAASERHRRGGRASTASSSGPPAAELFMSEPIHPSRRHLLEDRALELRLSDWSTP